MHRRSTFAPLMILACAMLLLGCARERVYTVKPYAEVAANKAVQPANRMNRLFWRERHAAVLKHNKQDKAGLILIGDSITHGWDKQAELWQKHFAPYNAVNLGYNGDQTQHVIWRLQNGEVEGIHPKLAVLMIGTNNSGFADTTPEQMADGIIAICRELRARLPQTKILLLAIFPRGEKPSPQREKNARASHLASTIADGKWIHYQDINEKFLQPDGTLSTTIMPDLLHPNQTGYQIWADAMMPKVKELTGN